MPLDHAGNFSDGSINVFLPNVSNQFDLFTLKSCLGLMCYVFSWLVAAVFWMGA